MLHLKQVMATTVEFQSMMNVWVADMENQHQNFSKQLAQTFQQANATLVELVTRSNQEIRLLGDQVAEVREDYEEVAGVFGSVVMVVRALQGEYVCVYVLFV